MAAPSARLFSYPHNALFKAMADLHKVKQETFDIDRRINIDPKGYERSVDTYELSTAQSSTTTPHPVLYMRRPTPGHPRFHYLESWLLPRLDIRLNKFHFFDGIEPTQDLYIDIAFIEIDDATTPPTWRTRDIYVDVVTRTPGASTHEKVQVLDLDELGEALLAGYISAEEARRALDSTQRLLDGLHKYGSVADWLTAQGVNWNESRRS